MSEKTDMEKNLVEIPKVESTEIIDSELKLIDKVIQNFAPELLGLYQYREDEAEEQQVKTGLLHENRILGIMLKNYLNGKKKVSTAEVEEEYERYFKDVARSTMSTYLNMLKKESILYKERDGRVVYYLFREKPPKGISPFWFTRNFCMVPAYFARAKFFSQLYFNAKKHIEQYYNQFEDDEQQLNLLIENFKLITGIIILNIFKNRNSKCKLCQFSNTHIYGKLEEMLRNAIRDRSDMISENSLEKLIKQYSEIPIFNGTNISRKSFRENIVNEIINRASIYKKDLEFQRMLLFRRQDIRLKQKRVLEE